MADLREPRKGRREESQFLLVFVSQNRSILILVYAGVWVNVPDSSPFAQPTLSSQMVVVAKHFEQNK